MVIYFNESRAIVERMSRMATLFEAREGDIGADDWGELEGQLVNPGGTRENLRQKEQFLRVLKSLASTYESHIRDARAQAGVPRLTLESLPDELILLILGHARGDVYSLMKYSHVCSRLRTVILGSPSMWALITLDARLPARLIDLIARRSGDLGLTAFAHLFGEENTVDGRMRIRSEDIFAKTQDTLREIFKHCHRWKSAMFFTDEYNSQQLQRLFPVADLTSLRTLSLGCPTWSSPETRYHQNWTFHQLSKCTLSLDDATVVDIVAFIASIPQLTYLEINMWTTKSSVSGALNHHVPLHKLEHLAICTHYPERGAMGDLLDVISCPSLKCFSLCLPMDLWDYVEINDIMRRRYPSLTSFTFYDLGGKEIPDEMDIFIEDILCSLPTTIEKIRLETCSGVNLRTSRTPDIGFSTLHTAYPNLRDLKISHEWSSEDDFYINLSALLKNLGTKLYRFRFSHPEDEWEVAIVALRTAGVLVDPSEVDLTVLTPSLCGC